MFCEAWNALKSLTNILTLSFMFYCLFIGYKEKINILGIEIPIEFPGVYPNLTKSQDPVYKHRTVMRVGVTDEAQVYQLLSVEGQSIVTIDCPYGTNPLPYGQYCPNKSPCCHKFFLGHNNVPIWGNKTFSGVWDSQANLVHGTNGEQFRPGLDLNSELIIFNTLIKRALKFKSVKRVEYKGIHMIRFSPDLSQVRLFVLLFHLFFFLFVCFYLNRLFFLSTLEMS